MKIRKLISIVTVGITLFANVGYTANAAEEMRDISTAELVRDMGIGINLGNTFESCPNWYEEDWIAKWSEGKPQNYETAWGSPVITKEMIEGIAKEGFGARKSIFKNIYLFYEKM